MKPPSKPIFLKKPKGKPMLATKPKPKAKPKPASLAWHQAKVIEIPINEHDNPPLRNVTANVRLLRRSLGWYWRIHLESPLFVHDDPLECDRRRPAKSEQDAVLRACDMIRRELSAQVDLRIQRKETALAGVCSLAIFDVNQFIEHLKKFGDYPKAENKRPSLVKAVKEKAAPAVVHDTFCPKGRDIFAAAMPERKAGTAMAIAKRSDVPAVIDVPSTPAEKLTTEERRLLVQREKEIERSANAFLALGEALADVQQKRLYRCTHSTFEAYLDDRWHIERSVAYGMIAAVRVNTIASEIADKTGLRITNESQCRPLAKLDDAEIAEVIKRAAKRITPDAKGEKIPTAKIFAEVAREYTTPPEDLKRQKEMAETRLQKRSAVELIDQAEREEKAAAETGEPRVPALPYSPKHEPDQYDAWLLSEAKRNPANLAGIADAKQWREIFDGPPPADGSSVDCWNGREFEFSRQLHGVNSIIRNLWARHSGQAENEIKFRNNLSSLLRELAEDISGESTLLAGLTKPRARRAK